MRDTVDVLPGSQCAASHFQLARDAFSHRRIPDALDLLERAQTHGHDANECGAYRWSCLMLAGRFEEAWRESDAIALRGGPDPHRFWDGRPFTNRRVLIRCLHGLGDTIQFVRYAGLVKRDAARVIVQTHPQLISLLRGLPSADDVITWPDESRDPSIQWDQQIEVMELPRAFRSTLQTLPREVPYLTVDAAHRRRSRVPPLPGRKPRIGLQWGSGEWSPERSMRLADLLPILHLEDVEYYSFQRGAERSELPLIDPSGRIQDVSGDSPEIVEAAADLTHIDLLITVDTMLAHLAGALAIPVWVLLPWAADWRWMLERCDSPWYPTMRLFRQPAPGDWATPVRRLASELPRFLASAAPAGLSGESNGHR